jgi:dienelactone hydrolase
VAPLFSRDIVRIPPGSGRDEIEVWFYRPAPEGVHPVVVMGHGIGAVKAGGLNAFAERFSSDGFAVVVIDYRHWGGSAGQPRDVVNVRRQRDDYRAAFDWASSHPEIDNKRIVLWCTSFSGLHVAALAASDRRTTAAIAETDTQTAVDSALRIACRARNVELRRSPGGHYDVYKGGKAFEDVIDWQLGFLRRHAFP